MPDIHRMSGCDQLATTAADGNNLIEDELILMIHGAVSTQPNFYANLQNITFSNLYSQAPDFVVLYDWKTLLFIRDVKE